MTKENFTAISIILDRSGSMGSCLEGTITGFNEFIQKQKEDLQEGEECIVTLHQFDDKYQTDYSCVPIVDVPDLNTKNFEPRGLTALHDAIGKTINSLGQKLSAMPEDERPDTVVVMILTDGGENNSSEFSGKQISEMVKHQQDEYSWNFIFMGANQDAILTAQKLAIKGANALTYHSTSAGTRCAFAAAAAGLSKKATARRGAYTGGLGVAAASCAYNSVDNFTEEDREQVDKIK